MEKRKHWLLELAGIGLLFLVAVLVIFVGDRSNTFSVYFKDAFITSGAKDSCSRHAETPHDKLLGGLLSPDINEQLCLSRYKSSMYRKPSPFVASPYLIEKLRKYEEYHKKCGPHSELYKQGIDQLNSGRSTDNAECKYVIWTQINGLGNRMLSLVSTFLYALLTDRVLLVELTTEMRDVFCEPFPDSSWQLPPDFPIKDLLLKYQNADSPESYTTMLKNKNVNISSGSMPALVFFNAVSSSWLMENPLFCEDHQRILQKFNWMVAKSDGYYAAALFLLPMYRNELRRMFPVKESVFHHLGRYLFQPANPVWSIIERFYNAHLINSDEKIGFQIRTFDRGVDESFEPVYNRIMECVEKENLLPKVELEPLNHANSTPTIDKHISVLVVSLSTEFYERIKAIYYEKSAVSGELVAIYQPTNERQQDSQAKLHNQKALAEMFLLSYCDKIVTSAFSTFGYVAHGFAGSRPWALQTLKGLMNGPGPACVRSMSVEPCLHSIPVLECKENVSIDPTEAVPYLRQCDDISSGLKLYDLV